MPLIERIARAPHPVLSEEHDCVRALLLAELHSLERPGTDLGGIRGSVDDVPLELLMLRIEGHEPTGTVLLMAHYDSVPTGPGAGDDSVGVAVWLEAVRALQASGWQPRNDLLLLLTDGEELGLLGAQLFDVVYEDLESIKTVVNLEAIGNGGPAVLFELGPDNGPRVRTFAEVVPAPTGTSLGDAVYSRMPNDTDLSVFLRRGIGGFNLALVQGSPAYHAPHDTPDHLDPRSVQHMGECALALARHLGDADLDALDGPDATFIDLLGQRMVHHPRWLDPLPLLAGTALFLWLRRRRGTSWTAVAVAAQRHLLEIAAVAVGVWLAWWLVDGRVAWFTPAPKWVPGNTTSGALLFATLVLLVAGYATLRDRDARRPEHNLGALATWLAASTLALLLLPGAAFVLTWPFALAGLCALADEERARRPTAGAVVMVLTLTAALLLTLPIAHLLLQLFQRRPGEATFLFTGILASGALLFRPCWHALARGLRFAMPLLLTLGLAALLGSVFVARVLEWRQGALLP